MEEQDYALSEQMTDYLCNFVRSGDPNQAGELPTWIASDKTQKRVMMLGKKTWMGKPSTAKLLKIMFTNKAVGE